MFRVLCIYLSALHSCVCCCTSMAQYWASRTILFFCSVFLLLLCLYRGHCLACVIATHCDCTRVDSGSKPSSGGQSFGGLAQEYRARLVQSACKVRLQRYLHCCLSQTSPCEKHGRALFYPGVLPVENVSASSCVTWQQAVPRARLTSASGFTAVAGCRISPHIGSISR